MRQLPVTDERLNPNTCKVQCDHKLKPDVWGLLSNVLGACGSLQRLLPHEVARLQMLDIKRLSEGHNAGIELRVCSNVHTHHADETLVSVSSQYLPLQLSDSSLQSLHGGSRGLLLRYSGAEEREERRTEKCLVLTLQDITGHT